MVLLDHLMPDCDGAQLGRIIIQDESIKSTRLILLTSSGQRGDGQMFADIGFAGYLLKPVTQRDLTECLVLVLANTADSWHLRSQPMITRHALRAQRGRIHNRILLAEDNLVNQKVAVRLLEKLDYRVHVVADGLAAVAAWQSGNFDLILMDCQMPQMDGYEATREIRRLEDGQHHIPIVALTAHAMKGDEEKCRAAGMDDYLSKPIDRIRLDACLERLLQNLGFTGSAPAIAQAPAGAAPLSCPVDWEALLESIDGDKNLRARPGRGLHRDRGSGTRGHRYSAGYRRRCNAAPGLAYPQKREREFACLGGHFSGGAARGSSRLRRDHGDSGTRQETYCRGHQDDRLSTVEGLKET